jgi:excisionase family DNA binding protein
MPKVRLEDREKFSTGHLARLIQASRTTIVRWIEEGRLRARRTVGGWYMIPRDEVINFLWDLSFSKETPLRIWRAATLAYEEMTKQPKTASTKPGKPEKPGKRKKPKKKNRE